MTEGWHKGRGVPESQPNGRDVRMLSQGTDDCLESPPVRQVVPKSTHTHTQCTQTHTTKYFASCAEREI